MPLRDVCGEIFLKKKQYILLLKNGILTCTSHESFYVMIKQNSKLGMIALVFAFLFVGGVVYAIIGYQPNEKETTNEATTTEKTTTPPEYAEETAEPTH